MQTLTRKLVAGAAAVTAVAATMIGVAAADNVVTGSDVEKVPGSTGVATIYLNPGDPSDPVVACNASVANPVEVQIASNHAKVTVDSPGTVQLTQCGIEHAATIGYSVAPDAPVGAVATLSASAAAGTASDPNGEVRTERIKISNGPPPVFQDQVTGYPTYTTDSFTVTVVAPADPCVGRAAPTSAPTVTVTPASPNGSNGWYKTTAPTFTVSPAADAEYSLDNGSSWTLYPGTAVTLPEGQSNVKARNFLPASTDPACPALPGTESATQLVKVDTVIPTVDITAPSAGTTTATSVTVSGTYFDATSGVAGVTVQGSSETTAVAAALDDGDFSRAGVPLACGNNTITATASDYAGNTHADTVEVYRRCYTGSFLQPLDGSGVLNKAKLGRVVPVKVTIVSNDGSAVPTEVYWTSRQINCTSGALVDEVESYGATGSSNSGNIFRLADGVWIYNFDTSKVPGATNGFCFQLDIFVDGDIVSGVNASGGVAVLSGSGSPLVAKIQLTK